MVSENELKQEAKEHGYRPEILEKVYRLLDLLEGIMGVSYLNERLVLKGGTAINLFCTSNLPRLSVDIDLNYIGSSDRLVMLEERIEVEKMIEDICRRRKYRLHRNPGAHAGGKKVWEYQSVLGNKGRIEIDLNYMYRVPLFGVFSSSSEWPSKVSVPVLDIHELAAGKLHALLDRTVSRDLFDSYQLLTSWSLDLNSLRMAFVIYAGIVSRPWEEISTDDINFTVKDIRDKLIPTLKHSVLPGMNSRAIEKWASNIVSTCVEKFEALLPFNAREQEFLSRLQINGEMLPELISDSSDFCERVKLHPALLWRVKKAREKV